MAAGCLSCTASTSTSILYIMLDCTKVFYPPLQIQQRAKKTLEEEKISNFTCIECAGNKSEEVLSKLQNLPLASLPAAHAEVSLSSRSFILKRFVDRGKLPPRGCAPARTCSARASARVGSCGAARGGSLTAVGS